MQWPSPGDFREVRRGLPVVAAVLLVVAVFLPMWTINVHAVQYPGEVLRLHLYAYPQIGGDYVEMARLNHYIGFYYPDPVFWEPNYEVQEAAIDVPEWSLGPLVFVLVAGLSLFVAVAPTTAKLKRGLTGQLVGTVGLFAVVMADIQFRLYQAGHSLDPEAPVVGVEGFTPPLWGRYEVANITSYSRLGPGAYLAIVSVGLLVVAFYYRDSAVTFGELPERLRATADDAADRVGIGGDRAESGPGSDEPPAATATSPAATATSPAATATSPAATATSPAGWEEPRSDPSPDADDQPEVDSQPAETASEPAGGW